MTTSTARRLLAFIAAYAVTNLASPPADAADPAYAAPVRPITDVYFGTSVVDNYRYMENLKDPQVQKWMKGQAERTRTVLDLLPGRKGLLDRIHQLSNADLRRGGFVRRGQRYFYETFEPNATLPKLYYRDGLKGAEHLLVDPAALGQGTATHYALDWYTPSWDGRYLAYGISAGGSEQSVLHVLEVDGAKPVAEAIDRTSNSIVAWRPDNRSFFYVRYLKPTPETPPSQTEYNARTYLHRLGTQADGDSDTVVLGRGVSPRLDVPEGQVTYIVVGPDSNYAVGAANHNDDNNPSTVYVAPLDKVTGANTPWRKVADVQDGLTEFVPHGDKLYFLSQKGAPHFRVLSTPLAHPDVAKAQVVVPEGRAVITDFEFAREGLYVREREGAASRLRRISLDDGQSHGVALPFEGNVEDPVTDPRESGALFRIQGWVQPAVVMNYDPATDASSNTGLQPPSSVDTSQLESEEVLATSYDGTRVPLSIIHRKGLRLDHSHRTILEGYGSYGVSLEPRFRATTLAWIERGGVLAVAHVRGGGENGEDWHRGAFMLNKSNTMLDFVACGRYLVDAGYTTPQYLAAEGRSAGGITVGGAMSARPDAFGVILDHVGMSDTLRSETEPNGPPNVSEFGSVKTEAGFHGLYAMSAYAQVRDGIPYPAVLFATGVNDPRVAPWHMAKMAARVQAATSSQRPVLLRVDYDAGHGNGSTISQREVELADVWSFTLWQMGDPEFLPPAHP